MSGSTHINVALIGYGLGGKVFHAPFIRLAPGLRLHAVCTRSEERQAAAVDDLGDVITYSDLDQVLGDASVDMVVLATPHDTHAPMAVAAMDAGKHLVTDKVMCLNQAEARAMIEASQRNRVMLSVFQNRRWDGDFLTLRRLLAENRLGEVYSFESNITSFGGPPGGWRAWRRYGGGRTRDWGAHLVDQALLVLGTEVTSVFADFQYRYDPSLSDVESSAEILIRFASGIRFLTSLGSQWAFRKPRFELRGSEGGFRKWGVDPQETAIKLGNVGLPVPEDPERYELHLNREGSGEVRVPVTPVPGNYRAYYDNIADVLVNNGELMVKSEECLGAIGVIDAIMASAERGEVVRMETKGESA